MSTTSLPSYRYEPRDTEHLLAARRRPHGASDESNFVKNSRNGGVALQLSGQRAGATLPEYGRAGVVEGTVALKPESTESAQSVEVKIEGTLNLKEIAGSGTHVSSLCLDVKTLWTRDAAAGPCPRLLTFALQLPMTFSDGRSTYPLPPTYEAHLSGVPGFRANIDYAVTVTLTRHTSKISLFGLANPSVSTPFVYRPRSYPAVPIPISPPVEALHPSKFQSKDWATHRTIIKSKSQRGDDISVTLYLPALHVYSITEEIPFHLFMLSSPMALAAFLPYVPNASRASSTPSDHSGSSGSGSTKPGATRVQLLRQTAVDVRSIYKRAPLPKGNNTDIWKTVQIGEGVFRHNGGGGHDWIAWSGSVRADRSVRMSGFKASGLNVKDYFVFTMVPPDPGRSPFTDVRLIVPVKLTTDSWTPDAVGPDVGVLSDGEGDVPSLFEHETPELRYDG